MSYRLPQRLVLLIVPLAWLMLLLAFQHDLYAAQLAAQHTVAPAAYHAQATSPQINLSEWHYWLSADNDRTESIAFGDIDNDGDLDLVAGNNGQPTRLYLNEDGSLQATAAWSSAENNAANSVAL